MKVLIAKDYEEASDFAFNEMMETVKSNPNAVLGLATGSTPIGLYNRMVKDHQENGTSYKNIHSYNLDEYFGLAHDHNQSYFFFMNEHLFKHIDIDLSNTHVPSGIGDIQSNCDEYNAMLKKEPIDLQLLGIGSNGHIGFNEPGTSFDSVTHYIELKESTRQDNARLFFNGNIDEVPTHAITMGIKNILEAKKVLLIACGENKAAVVKALVEGEPTTDVPATALINHPNFTLVLDEAAASMLSK